MSQIKTPYLDLDQEYVPKAFVYLSKIGWLVEKSWWGLSSFA